MTAASDRTSQKSFRKFFVRGLGILLPTVLTIWILVAVYQFVDQRIAAPINQGVRWVILHTTNWPEGPDLAARRATLNEWWQSIAIGDWAVLNLIGLVVAIVLIYLIGRIVGSFIGHRFYARAEEMLRRVPGFKQIYPYVKQVTEFFVGDRDEKFQFSRVVAVEYPRKGLWSVGLVTGETLRKIQDRAARDCMTVFIPSSPTPFTGYVITVPKEETIDLPITIDEAFRFCVSGGVIVPENQIIPPADQPAVVTRTGLATQGTEPNDRSEPPSTRTEGA